LRIKAFPGPDPWSGITESASAIAGLMRYEKKRISLLDIYRLATVKNILPLFISPFSIQCSKIKKAVREVSFSSQTAVIHSSCWVSFLNPTAAQ
jgi:hypothetical protein